MKVMEVFGRAFVPKKLRKGIDFYLSKAGFQEVPYSFFGWLFILTLVITYFLYFGYVFPALKGKSPVFVMFFTFIFWAVIQGFICFITILTVYFYYNLKIYKRTKLIEGMLPEYLSLVVLNLKGGMSFEKSLWAAIKPQFEILADEMKLVSKRVMVGMSVEDALKGFADKYDSPILKRSFNLIIGEIKGGGKIVEVMEQVIKNLNKTKELKEEMAANVVAFMIFISVIVMVIAPVLFALASQLLQVILSLGERLAEATAQAGSAASLPIDFSRLAKNPEKMLSDFQLFSYGALGVISFFSSMIVAIIEKGEIRGGLKYVPLFVTVSLFIFRVSLVVLGGLFGGIVG